VAVRYFTDRDMGTSVGLALRQIGVEIQLYRDRYSDPMVPDDRWFAEVTAEGYVILSKDGHIGPRPNEREVVERVGARMIVLATRNATKLENLRALLIAWHRIEHEAASRTGPWMLGVERTGDAAAVHSAASTTLRRAY
jgi:hypothetical protein